MQNCVMSLGVYFSLGSWKPIKSQLQFKSWAAFGTSQPLLGVPPISGEGSLFHGGLLLQSAALGFLAVHPFSRKVQPLALGQGSLTPQQSDHTPLLVKITPLYSLK